MSKNVKKCESRKKFIVPLFSVVFLFFSIFFSTIVLCAGTHIDELYFTVVFFGIFAIIFEFLKIKIFKNNIIVSILLILSSGIMFVPVLTEDLWEEDVVTASFICFSSLFVLCYEIYDLFGDKYYNTQSYKMKCYKKVADMQVYLEKGIITQEEFEKNKKDILKRINNIDNNTSYKSQIKDINDFEKYKTIAPIEVLTKSIVENEAASCVINNVLDKTVESVKLAERSNAEWEHLYKSNFEKFWEMVIEEYNLTKLPNEIWNYRDDVMICGEDAKKVYLSRLRGAIEYNEWTKTHRPGVIDIYWNTLTKIKEELQKKTSDKVCMLDVIRKYEDNIQY